MPKLPFFTGKKLQGNCKVFIFSDVPYLYPVCSAEIPLFIGGGGQKGQLSVIKVGIKRNQGLMFAHKSLIFNELF